MLWNPSNTSYQTPVEIGGNAPGNGVGGDAKFSADGNYLSGSKIYTTTTKYDWTRGNFGKNFIFKSIAFPGSGDVGYAAGQSVTYKGNGIVMKTTDGGNTWTSIWTDTTKHGIEAMSFPDVNTGYVGGWSLYFAKTSDAGSTWTAMNPSGGTDVYFYTGIAFKDASNGVVTAQLTDGTAVYYTNDGGTTWQTGAGLSGIPYKLTYISGDTYILVTNSGEIQKSTDNGATWNTVYSNASLAPMLGIRFYNENLGIATTEANILKTTDGGTTWTLIPITSLYASGVLFRDVFYETADHYYVFGTPDYVAETEDGGATWTFSNQSIFNNGPALYEAAQTSQKIYICGSQGTLYSKKLTEVVTSAKMSRYDVNANQWTALGDLGYSNGTASSGGYGISGNGGVEVGNVWVPASTGTLTNNFTHGFAWSQSEGLLDLGSIYNSINRSTRANAVSADGNVIVGWQDNDGAWKSAVWRKNPSGGYYANEYIPITSTGSTTTYDYFSQLAEASCVSADGTWIGGYGDYAYANAWLWSAATGVKDLGNTAYPGNTAVPEGSEGRVAAMNSDASIVVGWYYKSGFWSDPEYYPFIWISGVGMKNITNFITDDLGYTLDANDIIYTVNSISPNGKYITGSGINALSGNIFTFRLDISSYLATKETNNSLDIKTYPNPVNDYWNIESKTKIDKSECYDASGKLLLNISPSTNQYRVNTSTFGKGVYFFKISSGNTYKNVKVIK